MENKKWFESISENKKRDNGSKELNVKFKKLNENAVIPTYGTPYSAGLDLTAVSKKKTDKYVEYDTGLAFEIPVGYLGLLFPRSSVSNYDLSLANAVGVIDSDYTGPIKLRFKCIVNEVNCNISYHENEGHLNLVGREYEVGDRVGQLIIVPYPKINLIETDVLNDTTRNENGFGSTGK